MRKSVQKDAKGCKRHVTRFLSDAYCKGIVRGQVEYCNLQRYNKLSSTVAAEPISTAAFYNFPGRCFLPAVNVKEWRWKYLVMVDLSRIRILFWKPNSTELVLCVPWFLGVSGLQDGRSGISQCCYKWGDRRWCGHGCWHSRGHSGHLNVVRRLERLGTANIWQMAYGTPWHSAVQLLPATARDQARLGEFRGLAYVLAVVSHYLAGRKGWLQAKKAKKRSFHRSSPNWEEERHEKITCQYILLPIRQWKQLANQFKTTYWTKKMCWNNRHCKSSSQKESSSSNISSKHRLRTSSPRVI